MITRYKLYRDVVLNCHCEMYENKAGAYVSHIDYMNEVNDLKVDKMFLQREIDRLNNVVKILMKGK